MRKRLSEQIRALITRSFERAHRGIFFIVGDRARDQVINLFNLWQSVRSTRGPSAAASVLWCYKDELGFSSQQKKRQRSVGKLQRQGLYEAEAGTPFELFLTSTEIRFCYYREANRVLGNTFDILVLQDFEGLTANLLCQTIETVRGGGLVFFLLKGMTALKQLYTLSMDVHARYRTERFAEIHPHFNERLLLSLSACGAAIFADDELNLLGAPPTPPSLSAETNARALSDILESLEANEGLHALVALCRTTDQATVLLALLDALTGARTAARGDALFLSASRGRGKSAALGLAAAGAMLSGAAEICLSAASGETVGVVFDFAVRGLEAVGFRLGADFVVQRDAAESPIEIQLCLADSRDNRLKLGENAQPNIRRQRLVFFPPTAVLPATTDLLIIDEAAAIPLATLRPLVNAAFCPVLVSSTIHGYEGTGRSLSLKLVEELRGKSRKVNGGRTLRELTMVEPIRYGVDDPVEQWLGAFLCLDAVAAAPLRRPLPAPSTCKLFIVRKETLFSFNRSSERFLAEMWALFVSSHYKNSPNDLQLLSDAPAHFLAVLLGPLDDGFPDILVAMQCAFEGETRAKGNARGFRPAGDLVPWALTEQFLDERVLEFLSVRVVRVATHPRAARLGYGSRALAALHAFFAGEQSDVPTIDMTEMLACAPAQIEGAPTPRTGLPPLLKSVSEVRPLPVAYLSVSFGLTRSLYAFWAKNGFEPFHLKQTRNEQTGEFNCMMIRAVGSSPLKFDFFAKDFRARFTRLLGAAFAEIEPELAIAVLNPPLTTDAEHTSPALDECPANAFSLLDLRRLASYCQNLSEHHLIRDLLPRLAEQFFLRQFPTESSLSYSQALILLALGLQNRSIEYIAERLHTSHAQILSLFNKAIRKLYGCLEAANRRRVARELGLDDAPSDRFGAPNGSAIEEFEEHFAKAKKRSKAE